MKAVRMFAVALVLLALPAGAAVKTWRVGDADHPWDIRPVSSVVQWGRGWAVEILLDEDGDGLVDEDPVELIDNDGDGLINEDPVNEQVDNDNDGLLNEDPVNGIDDDGDGAVDEDPAELFDDDKDGLVDEDGPDEQIDNDGDGLLNEDGLWTWGDDDFDGVANEDPLDGIDNDGDGLIDEDPYGVMYDGDDDCFRLDNGIFDITKCDGADEDRVNGIDDDGDGFIDEDDRASDRQGMATWLSPVRLDSTRNLARVLVDRYRHLEFGDGFITIPTEGPLRKESTNPFSPVRTGGAGTTAQFASYDDAVDGDILSAWGTQTNDANAGIGFKLGGYYPITRLILQPRRTLPDASPKDYIIYYGDDEDVIRDSQRTSRVLVPATRGESNIVRKDFEFDPAITMGAWYFDNLLATGNYWEIAEIGMYGDGYPLDGYYASEIIDVGPRTPAVRRYGQQWDRYRSSERDQVDAQFDEDATGQLVTWGKVRWKGRKTGNGRGDVRIQFRVGNVADTHVWQRKLGADIGDDRDENGVVLDAFGWAKLDPLVRRAEEQLPLNVLGAAGVGSDGAQGWSFWSAPFKFEDGLVDENGEGGIQLPLPSQTRYLQFRIYFDSDQHGAVALDWLEFDYDIPVVGAGIVAEIFPPRVPIGQEQEFRYFLKPFFESVDTEGFNRIEIRVPAASSVIDQFKVDGLAWEEVASGADPNDPFAGVELQRLGAGGQFTQAVIRHADGSHRLQIKVPALNVDDFPPRQEVDIEIVFRSTLFSGSAQFTSSVWNDQTQRDSFIAQPTEPGDASPELSTDAVTVVADDLVQLLGTPVVEPNPFTPNNDDINDAAVFKFKLFLVAEPVTVTVEIYDLSGRLVRTLAEDRAAGDVVVTWNGANDKGELVPPGVYVYRLSANDDQKFKDQTGTVALVY